MLITSNIKYLKLKLRKNHKFLIFESCFSGSEIPEPKKMNNGFPCWNEQDGQKCKNICKSKICSPCGCDKPGCPNPERCGKPIDSACNKNKDCCSLICENKKCAYNPKHPILPPKKGLDNALLYFAIFYS